MHNALLSPVLNMSGKTGLRLRFRRWLAVEQGIFDQAALYLNNALLYTNPLNNHVIDQEWKPPTHDDSWTRAHGPRARAGSRAPLDSCALCHREDTCAECHRVEQPLSHTQGFRLKGHGLLASMDRGSCAVCHEPSSCEACHAETLPLSHGGMWGGTKSLHCLTCHTPLEQNGCAVCHKGTPSHALAPPKPDWHDPAMNCTACHGHGEPLPHVDNGENCNLCHF